MLKAKVHDYWQDNICETKKRLVTGEWVNAVPYPPYTKEYFNYIRQNRVGSRAFANPSLYKDKYVLEVGVGSGVDFVEWVKAGAIAYGIDLTESAINHTTKWLITESLLDYEQPPKWYLTTGDAENLKFKTAQFDMVYCTPPDSIVSGSYSEIGSLKVDDSCFGSGKIVNVKNTFVRHYKGNMHTIKVSGILPIRVTPEHPIKIVTGEVFHRYKTIAKREFSEPYWKLPTELNVHQKRKLRDYVVLPRMAGIYDIKELDLSEYYIGKRSASLIKHHKLPTKLIVNNDLAWLLGLYVAEGSTSSHQIQFSLNQNEVDLQNRLYHILENEGFHPAINTIPETHGANVRCCSSLLTRAFHDWFGVSARTKRIPDFILLHKDLGLVKSFLEGYEAGDGCITTHDRMNAKTVSKTLALQLQILYARIGIFAKIYESKINAGCIRGREVSSNNKVHYDVSYYRNGVASKYFVTNDAIYCQIRDNIVSKYEGDVCNIGTSDDTYLLSNAIVHNCWGVLHHSPDTFRGISECVRVCKPGGEIKLMLYNNQSLLWFLACLVKMFTGKNIESPGTKAFSYQWCKRLEKRLPVRIVNIEQKICEVDLLPRYGIFINTLMKIWHRFDDEGFFRTIVLRKLSDG